jgi:hypothetical protein
MESPGLLTRAFFLLVQVSPGIECLWLPSISGYANPLLGWIWDENRPAPTDFRSHVCPAFL